MTSNWRQRQKQELRQLLYKTAVDLFEADGYERTTVKQVTDKVRVAKGTFFNHFPTKEHVIEEWYRNITTRSLETAQAREPTTAEEAVCDLFADMAGQATASPELLIAKSRNSSNPLLKEAEQAQVAEISVFLQRQCDAGKQRGELAADLDVSFFVSLLGSVLTGTSNSWVLTEPRFDFPAVIRQRIHFVFRAAKPAFRAARPAHT